MARILLGEELGAGWAGALTLGTLGEELIAAGHDCVFALRDLGEAHLLPPGVPSPLQAPVWRSAPSFRIDQIGRSAARIGGIADMLAVQGLTDPVMIELVVSAWERLIEMERPDMVIGHFAPALLLAAAASGIPRILVGESHVMPPLIDGRFPRHDSLQPPVARDSDLVAASDIVRRKRGLGALAGLGEIMDADARLIFGHPAFDFFHVARRETMCGPMRPPARPQLHAPPASGIVAILSITQGNIEDILFGLVAAGVPLKAHVRGAPPAMTHYLETAGAQVGLREAIDLIPSARLLVHQGTSEPATIAALAAVPQLLFPEPRAESRFIVERLEQLGIGRALNVARKPTSTVEAAARGAHGDGDFAAQCRYRAAELAVAGPFAGAPAIAPVVAGLASGAKR